MPDRRLTVDDIGRFWMGLVGVGQITDGMAFWDRMVETGGGGAEVGGARTVLGDVVGAGGGSVWTDEYGLDLTGSRTSCCRVRQTQAELNGIEPLVQIASREI